MDINFDWTVPPPPANALSEWLKHEKIKPYLLAEHLGLGYYTVYRLARVERARGRGGLYLNMDTLRIISAHTGIPIGRLAEDACRILMPPTAEQNTVLTALGISAETVNTARQDGAVVRATTKQKRDRQ